MVDRTVSRRPRRYAFRWGEIVPRHGDVDIAQLVLNEGTRPESTAIRAAVAELRREGYARVVTSALVPSSAVVFLDAGFAVRERLHLLEHGLEEQGRPTTLPQSLRRAWRADRRPVLALDALAFDDFWRLDEDSLREALGATPNTRFRVGARNGNLVAYAITGRAGPRGYLQRVAVHPAERGRGWGRSLVTDALRWLRHHGARRAYVNTQWENRSALSLYESSGFRRSPAALCVLELEL